MKVECKRTDCDYNDFGVCLNYFVPHDVLIGLINAQKTQSHSWKTQSCSWYRTTEMERAQKEMDEGTF